MKELLQTINSLEIAKQTNKKHSHLVRDIEVYITYISENPNLDSQDFFIESTYKADGNNKTYKCYECTKQGCEMIGNKMTGKKGVQFTAFYVQKFNVMENYLVHQQTQFAVPTTLADALRLAADEAEKNEQLQLENAEMKPKALFADAVRGSTNSCLVKDLSVLLKQNGINIGQNRLFKYFRENGYLGKGNGHYNKPTQRSLDQNLFEYREHFHTNKIGEVEIRFTPLVTGKGQTFFINIFLNEFVFI